MGVHLKNTVFGMALVTGHDREYREILHQSQGLSVLIGVKEWGPE